MVGNDHGGVGDRLARDEEVVDALFIVVHIEADNRVLLCLT